MQKRGSRLFVQNFLSHSTEKLRWGTLRCIRKLRVSKNFMHQRGGGITFLRRKFFVTQYRKLSLGNTSVFQKIFVILKNHFLSKNLELAKKAFLRYYYFIAIVQ